MIWTYWHISQSFSIKSSLWITFNHNSNWPYQKKLYSCFLHTNSGKSRHFLAQVHNYLSQYQVYINFCSLLYFKQFTFWSHFLFLSMYTMAKVVHNQLFLTLTVGCWCHLELFKKLVLVVLFIWQQRAILNNCYVCLCWNGNLADNEYFLVVAYRAKKLHIYTKFYYTLLLGIQHLF